VNSDGACDQSTDFRGNIGGFPQSATP
jgi:hypothetical protein